MVDKMARLRVILGIFVLSYAAWLLIVAIQSFTDLRHSFDSIAAWLAQPFLRIFARNSLIYSIAYMIMGFCLIMGRLRWVAVGLCGITTGMIILHWIRPPTLWSELVTLAYRWDLEKVADLCFDLIYLACHLGLLIWCLSSPGRAAFDREPKGSS